jgi:uncharacterized small protein (DUF1192 family)
MLFDEEDRPKPKPGLVSRKLEGLSREDLKEYMEFLDREKARAAEALSAKTQMEAAAASLFKS